MARTPNQWNFTTPGRMTTLFGDHEMSKLADRLDVSISALRSWQNGQIPSNRFQVAIEAMSTPIRRNTSKHFTANFIKDYIEATRITRDEFADLMGVDESTVDRWINEEVKPRQLSKLNEVLTTPRPYA